MDEEQRRKNMEAMKIIKYRKVQQIRNEINKVLQKSELSRLEVVAILEDLKISAITDILVDALIKHATTLQEAH